MKHCIIPFFSIINVEKTYMVFETLLSLFIMFLYKLQILVTTLILPERQDEGHPKWETNCVVCNVILLVSVYAWDISEKRFKNLVIMVSLGARPRVVHWETIVGKFKFLFRLKETY